MTRADMTANEKVKQAFSVKPSERPSIMQLIEDGHFRAADVLHAADMEDITIWSKQLMRRLRRRSMHEGVAV